jgi:hypothetical protein
MGQDYIYNRIKHITAGICFACCFLLYNPLHAQVIQGDSSIQADTVKTTVTAGQGKGGKVSTISNPQVSHHKESKTNIAERVKTDLDKKTINDRKTSVMADSNRLQLHSPKKAAWMSAALPGLGQIYNRKYWKLPIIYAGLGVCTYFIITESKLYRRYKETYRFRVGVDSTAKDWYPNETDNTILNYKEYHHRNTEIAYIAAGLIYLLNIVDASVDAHLYGFDVTDDLSLRIEPTMTPVSSGFGGAAATGISIKLKF